MLHLLPTVRQDSVKNALLIYMHHPVYSEAWDDSLMNQIHSLSKYCSKRWFTSAVSESRCKILGAIWAFPSHLQQPCSHVQQRADSNRGRSL